MWMDGCRSFNIRQSSSSSDYQMLHPRHLRTVQIKNLKIAAATPAPPRPEELFYYTLLALALTRPPHPRPPPTLLELAPARNPSESSRTHPCA